MKILFVLKQISHLLAYRTVELSDIPTVVLFYMDRATPLDAGETGGFIYSVIVSVITFDCITGRVEIMSQMSLTTS